MAMKYKNVTLGKVEAVFNKLGGMEGVERFLRGELKLVEAEVQPYLINCDADYFVPEGSVVVEHRRCGQLEWNPNKIELYLCDEQKSGLIEGHELRKKLESKPVLNACVLDYLLLAHPELIPNEWKGKLIFFWGTIYRYKRRDNLAVRYLEWEDGRWYWNFGFLELNWRDNFPAALCK